MLTSVGSKFDVRLYLFLQLYDQLIANKEMRGSNLELLFKLSPLKKKNATDRHKKKASLSNAVRTVQEIKI